MTTYNAIAATSEAIRRFLEDAPRPEFPQLDVDIYQPADFQKSVPAGGRVSEFLCRIGVNTTRRNMSPRRSEDGKTRFRAALPLDLYYLVTDTAEPACEPLSLQDLHVLGELVKENAPLSISYVARMIAIDTPATPCRARVNGGSQGLGRRAWTSSRPQSIGAEPGPRGATDSGRRGVRLADTSGRRVRAAEIAA